MPVFPQSNSLPSFHPLDSHSDSRQRWPTNDVQKRSRSSSTPPDSRFLYHQSVQQRTVFLPLRLDTSRAWTQNLKPIWTTGNIRDTFKNQGQGLIEDGGRSAIQCRGGFGQQRQHTGSSEAHLPAVTPGHMFSSLVDSHVIPRVATNAPRVLNRPRKDSYRRPKIFFYHKHEPHYGFTNFSSHPVMYEGRMYPTSEHLFQSFKFTNRPGLAEHIRTCSPRPSVAFSEARRFALEVRSDWSRENIKAMNVVLYNKFTQHKDLKRELLATGDAELIENSDKDAFWGCGADGKGRNELGKALEHLRTQLRQEERREIH